MPRRHLGRLGRTAAVKVVTFRVSQEERERLDGEAGAASLSPNELARRRTFGYGAPMSTDSRRERREMSPDSIRQDIRVEYDE
jgi:hypothetical protein